MINKLSDFYSFIIQITLFLLVGTTCYAQKFYDVQQTDSIVKVLSFKAVSENNTKSALEDIDDVLPMIKADSTKIFLLRQKAFLYGRQRNFSKALETHLLARPYIFKSGTDKDKIINNLSLTEIYNYLKMFKLSSKYTDEAQQIFNKNKTKEDITKLYPLLNALKQQTLFQSEKYDECIAYSMNILKESNSITDKYNANFVKMLANQFIGLSLIEKKKCSEALSFIKTSITHDKNVVFLFRFKNNNALAKILLSQKKIDSAYHVLNNFVVEDDQNSLDALADRYYILSKIHTYNNKVDLSEKYLNKKDSLELKLKNLERKAIDEVLIFLNNEQPKKDDKSLYVILALIGLILIFIALFYYNRTKIKRLTKEVIVFKEKIVVTKKPSIPIIISEEKEAQILLQLDKFEKSEKFLKPETSLNSVATLFKTNQTYLSDVINKHKGINFSTYIHQLRIKYLIKELESNPKLQTYKISYLAAYCGYSSYETFTRMFKSIVGTSPSSYLNNLKK